MALQPKRLPAPVTHLKARSPVSIEQVNDNRRTTHICKPLSKKPTSEPLVRCVRKRSSTCDKQKGTMATQMARHGSATSVASSTSKNSTASSPEQSKPNSGDADWASVSDPDQRRRIQNRIAQRKFREKARESKERAARELRNQEHAGNCYRIPTPGDFSMGSEELSGLPWGGISWGLSVPRNTEAQSHQSSAREACVGNKPLPTPAQPMYDRRLYQQSSNASTFTHETSYDNAGYIFDSSNMYTYGSLS